MSPRLTEQLAARREAFAAKAKPEWLETMHAATEALRDAGAHERSPGVGDPAPAITLSDPHGAEWSLTDFLGQGPVILSFYRGRW